MNRFITIEGMECSGKTTLSFLLEEYFTKNNMKSIMVIKDQDNKDILLKKMEDIFQYHTIQMDAQSNFLLHIIEKKRLLNQLIQSSNEKTVILDGYIDSTVIDNNFYNLFNKEDLLYLYGLFLIPTPSLTFYIYIDPNTAYTRYLTKSVMGERKDLNHFKNMYDKYDKMYKLNKNIGNKVIRIDGTVDRYDSLKKMITNIKLHTTTKI